MPTNEASRSWTLARLGVGWGLIPIGLVLLVAGARWGAIAEDGPPTLVWSETFDAQGLWGLGLILIGLLIGGWGAASLAPVARARPGTPAAEASNRVAYQRHLVGLGYALLVAVALLATLTLKLVFEDALPRADDAAGCDPTRVGVLLALAVLGAAVGALFFVANSLRQKRNASTEFSSELFWGGLWFRLGEAALFALVFFWLFWIATGCPGGDHGAGGVDPAGRLSMIWLPIVSLLLGMFVTSGERLVFALSRNVFEAITRFFDYSETPEPTRNEPERAPREPATDEKDERSPADGKKNKKPKKQ